MLVLAATFNEREVAERVLAVLRDEYQLGPADASVAPLAASSQRRANAPTVLAGRFLEDRLEAVRRLCESHGGRVVVVVDEVATRPRRSPEAGTV